jgi:hypothetical protein
MKTSGLGGKKPRPKIFDEVTLCNKSRSVVHEKRLEDVLHSNVTPNSGALPNISAKGDLQDSLFVWQAKLTDKSRFTITPDVLLELNRQASMNAKWPAMALTLEGLPDPLEKDLVVLPASIFTELIEVYRMMYKDLL